MEVTEPTDSTEPNRTRIRNRMKRRFIGGLNSSLAIVLMLILVIMFNYLSARNYLRFDWSRDRYYHLSEKTTSLLQQLPEKVKITVFIQPGHEIYHLVYDDVVNILHEYEYVSDNHIIVERVDPDRNIARAEEIMTRFELPGPNNVIFEYGDRRKIVGADELFDMDYRPMLEGDPPEKVAFRGEQVFTSALLSITQSKRPKIYFFQGHGERDFNDRDESVGLSAIGQQMRRDDMDIEAFNFIRQNNIPDDADAIIIAGPTHTFAVGELERISAYAKRAGRMILMLNSETDAGFGPLLNEWGIESVNNLVVDPTHTLSGFDLLISDYADHPITRQLKDITTVFYWPRALPVRTSNTNETRDADEPLAIPLAMSSPNAWAELEIDQKPYRFDTDRDIKGPIPVAVAVERGPVTSVDMDIQPMRAILFGDADFVSNSGLSGGNSDLFMNALNWILQRDQLMSIAPKPVKEARLIISRSQLSMLFWVVVAGVPALVAALGVSIWWTRRN